MLKLQHFTPQTARSNCALNEKLTQVRKQRLCSTAQDAYAWHLSSRRRPGG
jgi:hypothetical protein